MKTTKQSKPKTTNRRSSKKSKSRHLASERFETKSRFYKGTDIEQPFDAVISKWTTEEIGEEKEEKDVLWLDGHEKGIVLNQTMALQLSEDLDDDMDTWPGCTIHVFTERVRNPRTRKLGPAVRVRGADVADEDDDFDDDFEDNDDDDEDLD
jgi:hypothetical protein